MKYALKPLKTTVKVQEIAYVHFFEFQRDFFTQPENHPFYELVFVSGGNLDIRSEDFNGRLEKNQMIIHRPDEYHSLSCDSESNPTVIIIGFSCTENDLSKFSKSPVTLGVSDIKKLAEIIKEARNVFSPPYDIPLYDMKKKKNPPFGAEQMLGGLIEYFLINLIREYASDVATRGTERTERFSANEIVAYISDNYKEKITLDELAFIFRTNRSTLCKEFKSATGNTVIGFMNDKKIQEAKREILTTDLTFTEIAENLNFESIHYFTRLFKSVTGLSPKDFKNANSIKS